MQAWLIDMQASKPSACTPRYTRIVILTIRHHRATEVYYKTVAGTDAVVAPCGTRLAHLHTNQVSLMFSS